MPEKNIRLMTNRQDIRNPDNAAAFLHFDVDSDGDVEMTVRWGEPERPRGTYLIPRSEADLLLEWLEQRTDR